MTKIALAGRNKVDKMKRKSTYLVVGVIGAVLFLFGSAAQPSDYLNVEDSGFTKLPVNARALGMGGAFVAVADDYSACYYNPAGLVHLPSRQIGSMYTDLFKMGLLSHSFLGFAEPDTGMGSGALTWSHLSANLEPEEWSFDVWSYSYANYLFGKEITPVNSWGMSLKYISQNTPYEDGSGYSLDVGYLWKGGELSWGICVQDLFSRIDWGTGHTDTLPVGIITGIAFNLKPNALVALQVGISPKNIPRNIRMGGEWELRKNIFFRAGLVQKFQKDENLNFSTGIGLKTGVLRKFNLYFNYAFITSKNLSGTHYLSFSLSF